MPFFRFPGFADTPMLDAWLAIRGVAIFGADLWASDWLPMSPDAERALILQRLAKSGGGILLLHDTHASTAAMLPQLLRDLKAADYRIVHVIPGPDAPPLRAAPAGWTSETDAIIAARFVSSHSRRRSPHASHRPSRKNGRIRRRR